MAEPKFFADPTPVTIEQIVAVTGCKPADGADVGVAVSGVAPLDRGEPGYIVFLDNAKYAGDLAKTRATACLIGAKYAAQLPQGVIGLVTPQPYKAFAQVLALMYPAAKRPQSMFGTVGIAPGAFIHPTARLEADVTVDPNAIIGPGAEIGSGTLILAGAVIGPEVRVGRDCVISSNATVQHALIGNRVIIHPGVSIGQDGFGFAMGPGGHLKVPQVGRVIIQDDVEIGANTTIDRGANRDTVIGEGTKIDNLVQIGHNVSIGRHCVIVSQVGISGSTILQDYAVLGGQAGIAGHLTIGMGAQIAAKTGLMTDVPAGAKWGGIPGRPGKQWLREVATLSRLASKRGDNSASE